MRYPKFVEQVEQVKREHLKELAPDLLIDRALAIYLYNMTDLVNEQFFCKLEEVLVLLRICLNRHHKQIERSYQKSASTPVFI